MYFVVASSCNRITPFIVCISSSLEDVNEFLDEKLETPISQLEKYTDPDCDDIPYEFSDYDRDMCDFVGAFILNKTQWDEIYSNDICTNSRCPYKISIFKKVEEMGTLDIVNFMKNICLY